MRLLASLVVVSAVIAGCGDNHNPGAPADGGGLPGPGPGDGGGGGSGSDGGGSGSGSDGGVVLPQVCGDHQIEGDEACDDGNLADWDGCDATCVKSVLTYVKASNTDAGDTFGSSVAMSADGSTLAIGAPQEASNATGVGGDPTNNAARGAGAVYVYARTGSAWKLEAYVKASNTELNDQFGSSVALSADGSTLAVGATEEDSANADPANNGARNAGAVYVFTRTAGAWSSPPTYVKASTPGAEDLFGASVALSGDGQTLAVGADGEAGSATGINGTPDTAAKGAGAAYVFTVSGGAWTQQAYVKASNTNAGDAFGHSVSLSNDGATLAVGAYHEAGGLADNAADNSASNAGAAYVFTLAGGTWAQQAYVKTTSPSIGDLFGVSVSLAGDGATLAVGAEGALVGKGAAFVFARTGDAWGQSAQLKPSNAGGDLGVSVALSADGSHLAAGAFSESSSATGVGGDQTNTAATFAGATYVFAVVNKAWTQTSYVKAFNTDAKDFFGMAVALSRDGGQLAVGASLESSNATGLNGDGADNSAVESGAVYVYQ